MRYTKLPLTWGTPVLSVCHKGSGTNKFSYSSTYAILATLAGATPISLLIWNIKKSMKKVTSLLFLKDKIQNVWKFSFKYWCILLYDWVRKTRHYSKNILKSSEYTRKKLMLFCISFKIKHVKNPHIIRLIALILLILSKGKEFTSYLFFSALRIINIEILNDYSWSYWRQNHTQMVQ